MSQDPQGGRFGPLGSRRRGEHAANDPVPDYTPYPTGPPSGQWSVEPPDHAQLSRADRSRIDRSRLSRQDQRQDHSPIPRQEPIPPAPPERMWPELDPSGVDPSTLVRPYIRTGGRTRGPADLGMETLVSVAPGRANDPDLQPDHRMIVALCTSSRSLAEVAALSKLPLGVARVLLADLARIGVIRVHGAAGANAARSNSRPDMHLMERVLAGLRRL